MRVNVYEEELTDEVKCLKQKAKTGSEYYGVRFYLRSPKELHKNRKDDDRSAVTFWAKDRKTLVSLFARSIDSTSK